MPTWLQALLLSLLLVAAVAAIAILSGRCRRVAEAWTEADEKLPASLCTGCKFFLTSLRRFPDNVLVWKDASEHTDPPMYVPEGTSTVGHIAVRDFTFSTPPSYDEDMHAFHVGGITLTGPLSMDLGLYANDRFTFLWQAHMERLPETGQAVVFETRANTVDNLGFRVLISAETRDDGASVHRVVVEHCLVETERRTCSWVVPSLHGDHFIAVVHDPSRRFRLYFDGSWVPESEPAENYVNAVESVLYSNRNCVVNPDGKWDARVTALALYRTDLSEAAMDAVAAYVSEQRVRISATYQDLVREREEAEKKRRCPFDDVNVCSAECANVADWTDILAVGRDTSVTCRQRIMEYCSLHPAANSCTCLAPDDASDPKCASIRAFFDDRIMSASCPVRLNGEDEPTLERYKNFSLAAATTASAASPAALTIAAGLPTIKEVFT